MSEIHVVDQQSMRHMLAEGGVDWQGFGRQIAAEANALWGGAESVLIFDESGFAMKGPACAGVARQWTGRLGQADNGQVGVFATLCRGDLATLIIRGDTGPTFFMNPPHQRPVHLLLEPVQGRWTA